MPDDNNLDDFAKKLVAEAVDKITARFRSGELAPVLPPEYVDTKQLATILSVPAKSLEAHRTAGTGPPYVRLSTIRGKGRGTIRYSLAAVREWMTAHQVDANQ